MINITDNAKFKLTEILADEVDKSLSLRVYVQGGGCSGFQYGFSLDNEQSEDDFVLPAGEFNVLVDSMSMQYLQGSVIDYKDDLTGSNFVIQNPNAESTCGCGSSFSVS